MAVSLSAKPGLEDMEALLWAPSFSTADPLGRLPDEDKEEIVEEGAPFHLSLSSSSNSDAFPSTPLSTLSPPFSPASPLGCKTGVDLLAFPWLSADELLYCHISAGSSNEDTFSGMDWMAEKMNLSEFDLDSFMGPCDTDESPSSPDELVASLESTVGLGLDTLLLHHDAPQEMVTIALPDPALPLPEPKNELEIKSEPASPVPCLSLLPPPSPTFTLELGSEVDVSESEKVQVPSIVLSLTPSNLVFFLALKEEPAPDATMAGVSSSDEPSRNDSDVSSPRRSLCSSQYSASCRLRPASETPGMAGKVKSATKGRAPKVVEKKLKKMEQNKTAATRYRQKKRVEQEALGSECVDLEQRNRELAEKAESISKEIQYLKNLIEEVRTARSRKPKGMS